MEGERAPRVVVGTEYDEQLPAVSPNGRWLAYVSDVTGRDEIWVAPYPGPGAPRPVSLNGGTEPVWSRDGQELFYLEGSKLLAVPVETDGTGFGFQAAVELFDEPYDHGNAPTYDVAPDGRFVMLSRSTESEQARVEQLVVVLNWTQELLERVPTGQ